MPNDLPTDSTEPYQPSSHNPSQPSSTESTDETRQTAEERRLEAERRAKETDLRLEEQRLKNLKFEERVRRRTERKEGRKTLLRLLTPKRAAVLAGALIVLICLAILILPGLIKGEAATEYLTATQLEKVVSISKLSTAEYVYNGIAEVKDNDGNVRYRIYYASSVKAGIDMSDIEFDIDNEGMTVTPIIPEVLIDDPSIDESSFEYMPDNPDLELQDIIRYCKDDVTNEVEEQGEIYKTAEENIRTTIEGLTLPLLEDKGYTLKWPDRKSEDESSAPDNESIPEEQNNEA